MAAFYYVAMFVAEFEMPSLFRMALQTPWTQSFKWLYGLAFLGFGILLQGAVTRLFGQFSPTIWRPLMLCLGAGLALLQLWIIEATAGIPMSADVWMSAVLGLAVVAVLARVLPEGVVLYWYGVQR